MGEVYFRHVELKLSVIASGNINLCLSVQTWRGRGGKRQCEK